MSSPLASPRSSTSSTTGVYSSEPPLTPMSELGLEKATGQLVLADNDEEDVLDTIPESESVGPRVAKEAVPAVEAVKPAQAYRTRPTVRSEAQDQFAGFSFGRPPTLAPPISTPDDSYHPPRSSSMDDRRGSRLAPRAVPTSPPRSPDANAPPTSFSFGSCPSAPLANTPTAELGAFEYPEFEVGHPLHPSSALEAAHMRGSTSSSSTSSSSSSYSRASTSSGHRGSIPLGLALGQSHRRNSIISRPPLHPSSSSSNSTHTALGYPSPPQTRRSSTTSTITTLPAGGRRPSIIHSATIEGSTIPLPSISSIYPGAPDSDPSYPPPSPYNNVNRRASILFPPKHLHQPVPPSLLARRGSMPVSSLAGLPGQGSSPQRTPNTRTSISIPLSGYGGPGQITAHRLYNRRESVLSVGSVGSSTASGSTVRMAGREAESGQVTRRSSLRENGRRSGAEGQLAVGTEGRAPQPTTAGLGRRSSMPIHHALSATTRVEEEDRTGGPFGAPAESTRQPAPHSPASPRSASSRGLPSYGSPVRRSRGSVPNALVPDMAGEEPISPMLGSGAGTRWTPRPSMSGRSLSSSEESDESGEVAAGGEEGVLQGSEGMGGGLFSDPWAQSQGARSEGGEEIGKRRVAVGLVESGRPGLDTVDSDRTERG